MVRSTAPTVDEEAAPLPARTGRASRSADSSTPVAPSRRADDPTPAAPSRKGLFGWLRRRKA
jgi:hypothetical protein